MEHNMNYRSERDSMGEVKIPADAYYGAQTQRAIDNFQVSGLRFPFAFIRAQAIIKRAAALANAKADKLKPDLAEAIVDAAEEILAGELVDQFVLDIFQAGAGTSQNMNMNEVLANRACELLGTRKGDTTLVNPNDHVNMSQSTNDTIHVAIHIAAYGEIQERLLPSIESLQKALQRKSVEFDHIIKTGRTHLQDAVPIRLGQEFGAYASMMANDHKRLKQAAEALLEICIGGTAVGTGLNTVAHYHRNMLKEINESTGYEFRLPENMFEGFQSFDSVLEVTGAMRVLITGLRKIADDFRLLASGPRTGFAEITLPPVQPGSSIMPGKVNPVLAEMLDMVCFHAMGLDTAITLAAQAGQLELNVMMPIIAYDLLSEINILTGGINSFTRRCVEGITANEDICLRYAERSSAVATALSPVIGYLEAAKIAKEALEKDVTVRELVLGKKLLDEKTLEQLLDLRKMTDGGE
jgi:fumarate hydratase, class II